MQPATLDYDARWGYRQFDARRYERRRYGGAIRRLNHRPLGRALRRALGRRAKQSPRLTRRALAAELDAAGLQLERVIPVMPLLSEVWVVVVRKPGSS